MDLEMLIFAAGITAIRIGAPADLAARSSSAASDAVSPSTSGSTQTPASEMDGTNGKRFTLQNYGRA